MVGYFNVLGTLTPEHVHLLPVVFVQFHMEQKWGMDKCRLDMVFQERLKIDVKLLFIKC